MAMAPQDFARVVHRIKTPLRYLPVDSNYKSMAFRVYVIRMAQYILQFVERLDVQFGTRIGRLERHGHQLTDICLWPDIANTQLLPWMLRPQS